MLQESEAFCLLTQFLYINIYIYIEDENKEAENSFLHKDFNYTTFLEDQFRLNSLDIINPD